MIYYLCVLDFEATCWKGSARRNDMEIIEFPSVLYKVNEDTNTQEFISEFAKYVKPTKNIISDFCTELTGITNEKVKDADKIHIVYKEHMEWLKKHCGEEHIVIATCGKWDLSTMLPNEIMNKRLPVCKYYSTYINVKDEFSYVYKQKVRGMTDMLTYLKLKLEGRHHSGIDDTRNIAKIMLRMIKDKHSCDNFMYYHV
jgi:ERI1 exoribonuclease 3